VFRKDWYLALKNLGDSTRLEVYDAIMREVFGGDEIELSSEASVAMMFITPLIKRDVEKYNLVCERRKLAGSQGGIANASKYRQKVANASKYRQKVANEADNDNDILDTDVSMSIKEEDTNVSKKKVFVPPTEEEVAAYIREKNFHFDAKTFIDYYEADDWHYGQGAKRKKVQNWKRCCLTWEEQRRKDSPDMFEQQEEFEHPKVLIINGQVYR